MVRSFALFSSEPKQCFGKLNITYPKRNSRTKKALFLSIALLTLSPLMAGEDESRGTRIYLSVKGPSDAVEWGFHCPSGRRSGEWGKIPVPSNWEQHGFGGYDYGHVPADEKHDEVGTYRTTFQVPEEWKNKVVRLVFEGSMTVSFVMDPEAALSTGPN